MAKVAINGLGRIGRATLKILLDTPGLEPVAINDLVPAENLAYLLRYDSVYGRYGRKVEGRQGSLVVDGREIRLLAEKDPARLPWRDLRIDFVFECTGLFTNAEGMSKHLEAGADRVILSAPVKGEGVPTVVHGVNRPNPSARLISLASCTTNCIAPVAEVMRRRIGFHKAIMTTVHAYTSSQKIVDGPAKQTRRGRAGAANLVPTTTGAARATAKAIPELAGIFDGAAIRAPVPVGSIADLVFLTERPTSVDEVNGIFREEADSQRYRGILGVAEDEFVSSDIIGDSRASVFDPGMTMVVDGDLVKVFSWYDNEWGYSAQMVREVARMVNA